MAMCLKDGVITADCGFTEGKTRFKHMLFFTSSENPQGRPKKTEMIRKMTSVQKNVKREVKRVRVRGDLPYALLKNKWNTLGEPFRECEESQDDLVAMATAFHNCSC